MKPGPKKKPAELKRRAGNPGKQALPDLDNVVQLEPVGEVPDPIRPLSPAGDKAWRRAWDHAGQWLSHSDLEAVQLYAEAVDDYVILRTKYHTNSDDTDRDLWRMRKQVGESAERVMRMGQTLGLNPSSRSDLGVAEVRMAEGIASLTGVTPSMQVRSFDRVLEVEE